MANLGENPIVKIHIKPEMIGQSFRFFCSAPLLSRPGIEGSGPI